MQWTARQLSRHHRKVINALPLITRVEDATLVHSSPVDPSEWEYLIDREDGVAAFRSFPTRLCFVGHSHLTAVWCEAPEGYDFSREVTSVTLKPEHRYLINVGSVGQPRDRDPRASCAIWDTQAQTAEIRRVPYDLTTTQSKIRAAGLPRVLADRLSYGS